MINKLLKRLIAALCGNLVDIICKAIEFFHMLNNDIVDAIVIVISLIAITKRMEYLITLSFLSSPMFWFFLIINIVNDILDWLNQY